MIKTITKNLQPALGLVAGSVGSGMVARFIPVGDDKIKNGIVMLGGLFLMGSGKGKDKFMGHVGAGMIAGAGARLAQSFGIGAVPDPIADLDLSDISGYDDNSVINGMGEGLPEDELA